MGLTINSIASGDSDFLSLVVPSAWTAVSGSLSVNLNEYKNVGSGSLALTPSASSPEVKFNYGLASYAAETQADYIGDKAESYVWIRATKNVTVTPTLTLTRVMTGTPTSSDIFVATGETVNITSGEWYLVRTDPLDVPALPSNAHYGISLKYVFSCQTYATTTVYINKPTVYNQLAFLRNYYLMDVWAFLPQIFKDNDLETPLPSYPILRLAEIGMSAHGILYDLARGFQYSDISEGKDAADSETLSLLVDTTRVPREYMPWLAQFTGTKLLNPVLGSTPWANIPLEWDDIDAIDTTTSVNDAVAWGELQEFAPEIAGLDEFFQWQIETGYYGYAAGSLEAVRESIRRGLTGTKTCVVTKRYTGSPWKILIQTKWSETPDAVSAGQSIGEMLELMELARPLGVSLTHQTIV
jgi:hypothetical protein